MTDHRGNKRNILAWDLILDVIRKTWTQTLVVYLAVGQRKGTAPWELYSWLKLKRRVWDPWLGISVLYPGTEAAHSVYHLPVCAEWEEQRMFPSSGSHHNLLCWLCVTLSKREGKRKKAIHWAHLFSGSTEREAVFSFKCVDWKVFSHQHIVTNIPCSHAPACHFLMWFVCSCRRMFI